MLPLIRSIVTYTRYKVLDGIVTVASGDDVAATRLSAPLPDAGAALEWTPVLYCYLRRWLQASGMEAVAGAAGGRGRQPCALRAPHS